MKTATYSLLTLRPDAERIDVLCVGVVARGASGDWHVATLPSSQKLTAVALADDARLPRLAVNLQHLLAECDSMAAARERLQRNHGALALHEFEGAFAYESEQGFRTQVQAIMAESVLPPSPPALKVLAADVRRVRLLTRARLRQHFESMGILGKNTSEIVEHKVVRNYPVSARHGLTAEFALQNSVMHITETVDFDVSDDSVRGKRYEAQAKCLVMRAARENFGEKTECYVVVSGGSAPHAARSVDLLSTAGRLFAAESSADMALYLDRIAKAAGATGQLDGLH